MGKPIGDRRRLRVPWVSATAMALLLSCGGRTVVIGGNAGATAGGSGGLDGNAALGGATTSGISGGSTTAGSGAIDCALCREGSYCSMSGECVRFSCSLSSELCAPSACEGAGESGCGLSSAEITPLAGVSDLKGLCHDGTDLFVVDDAAGSILRLSWPGLESLAKYPAPGPLLGDCGVLDGAVFFASYRKAGVGRLDLASSQVSYVALPARISKLRAVASDGEALWVSADEPRRLFRVSPRGELLATIPVSTTTNGCDGLEATPTGLWCLDLARMTLSKLSPTSGVVLAGPFFAPPRRGLALIDGTLWAGSDGLVYALDGFGLTGTDDRFSGIAALDLFGTTP